MAFWQQTEKLTCPTGTTTFTLKHNQPLERLTIWITSAARTFTATFQPQVNGRNLGASTTVTARAAADVILSAGGATSENLMIPYVSAKDLARTPTPDVFVLTVVVTNAGASFDVTFNAAAIAP